MTLLSLVSATWSHIQGNPIPWLRAEFVPLEQSPAGREALRIAKQQLNIPRGNGSGRALQVSYGLALFYVVN